MEEIKDRMKTHEITFKKSLSKEAKDIMLQLLRFDPAERLTLDKVFRHPFILKHIDDFESNRDSFKYIPPEPEWDNDLDIHPPLGLNPGDPQRTFEEEVLNDPLKQHEYISSKLAEAKINPNDVEKVFFIRDDNNNLKMRLQMKDRPQPKRGNSERKITTSFSQRFVPSVKRSDGSPRKYNENTTNFENILKDNTFGEPEYSLGDDAQQASAFLNKFDGTKVQNISFGAPKVEAKDVNPNLKLNVVNQDLEYKLISDRRVNDYEPYSQEIMPSELGSPGRSDLGGSVSSKQRLEKMNSFPHPATALNFDNPQMTIQNPYSIGSSNSLPMGSQGLNSSQTDNGHSQGNHPAVAPLTLQTSQKKDKTENPRSQPKKDPAPTFNLQAPQPVQEQAKMISIKSSDNLFKYEINQDPQAFQYPGGSMTPPPTSLHRPPGNNGFQPHQVFPLPPFNTDGPVNQQLPLSQGRPGEQPHLSQGYGGQPQASYTAGLQGHQAYQAAGPADSGAGHWMAPSFHRPPDAGFGQNAQQHSPFGGQQQPSMVPDFKVKDAPQVNKADPITPLAQLKSPLNQPLRLNQREDSKHYDDKNTNKPRDPVIPNASSIAMKVNTNLGTPQGQTHMHLTSNQTNFVNQITDARPLTDHQPERKQSTSSNPEPNYSQSITVKAADNLNNGPFKPIVITGTPFKNETLISSTSRTDMIPKTESSMRAPLEDLAKNKNQPPFTYTPKKEEPYKDSQHSSDEKSRKFSGNFDEDSLKQRGQLISTGLPTQVKDHNQTTTIYSIRPGETRQPPYDNLEKKNVPTVTDSKPNSGPEVQQGRPIQAETQTSKSHQASPKKGDEAGNKSGKNPLQASLSGNSKNYGQSPIQQPLAGKEADQFGRRPQESPTTDSQRKPL
jgi:hypothetical protein